MLKSFVSESDYPKLIETLIKIKENKLNEEVSIIQIYGSKNSGKSTLELLMFKIADCLQYVFDIDSNDTIVSCLQHPLFHIPKKNFNKLQWINELIKSFPLGGPNNRAGIGIMTTNEDIDLDYDLNATRKVIYIHLPNVFDNTDYIKNKLKNNIYFQQESDFKDELDREIIKKCLKEFEDEYQKYLGNVSGDEKEIKDSDIRINITI